jgi:hypothetical protein
MRYPLDENVDQYPGKIHFIPIVERYVDAAQITAGNLLEAIGVDQFNGEGGAGEPGMRSSGATAPSPKSYSVPLTTYGQNASGPVTLYLPQAIVVADQVNYERINLGIIGASALTALQSGKSVTEAISGALAEAGRSASDFLTNRTGLGTQLAGLAAVRLAETVGNDTFRGVSRAAFGVAVNPNTKSLFNSVELRTFSFSFKMIASSAAEANAIENIIYTFRKEVYPREILGPQNVSVGYIFPNKFRIRMTYNGKPVATKFLDSNLISVQTTYNPSSMGWHVDGKPSEVDLTLNFGEPRALSKKDIEAGY